MLGDRLYSGQRFRRALRAFLLGRAAQGVANVCLTLWVVRLLAGDDYGAYMTLWGLVELLVPLSSLGLLDAVRRYLPDLATRGSTAAVRGFVRWTNAARLVVLAIVTAMLYATWASLTGWLGFSDEQIGQSVLALPLLVAVLYYRYICEMLECLLEQRWSQSIRALNPIGRLAGVAVLVVTSSLDLAAVLIVDLVVSVLCVVLAEWALIRKVQHYEGRGDYAVTAPTVLKFVWHMAGANLLQAVASVGAIRLIAAHFLGLELAGLYAFVQQLVIIVGRYMPSQLLANVIRPMLIARHAAGDRDIVSQGVAAMWKSNVFIVLAMLVSLAPVGDELIGFASGDRFRDAGLVALLMFLGLGANSQGFLVAMAMQIHDRARALRTLSLLFLVIPVAAWAGAARGLEELVAGVVAAQWLYNAAALWWMRRNGVGVVLDSRGALRMIILGLLAGALGMVLAGGVSFWVVVVVSELAFIGGMLIVRPLSSGDQELLTRAARVPARYLRRFVWEGRAAL